MNELILKFNYSFTNNEKEQCKPTIYKLVRIANLTRQMGIVAFKSELDQESSIFMKTAFGLLADGVEQTIVKQILQNLILADDHSGVELLNRLLIFEGAIAIQDGELPRLIEWKLFSMLGERYIPIDDICKSYSHSITLINAD